jgi:MFS family permease
MNRPPLAPLMALFAVIYFVQGIIEPSACLPSQPLQTQLRTWNFSTAEVGYFFFVIGLGWSIKPIFGLISDFLPIGGRRRRPYLVLATAATSLSFLVLATTWGSGGAWLDGVFRLLSRLSGELPSVSQAGWLLLMAGLGVAMTDVVVDALGVERGQALGITGEIQAVQWGGLSVAGLVAGSLGGYIAQHDLQKAMFAGCAALAGVTLAIAGLAVREERQSAVPRGDVRVAAAGLPSLRQLANLAALAAFLFLWNFNPFSSNVLQEYATQELRFSEQFYGHLISIQAVGNILACAAYFWFCRYLPQGLMIHGCILAGMASTAAYWAFEGPRAAIAVSLIFGLTYQLGLLMQFDLAARNCPAGTAATSFAILMAISNVGVQAGINFGGAWYEALATSLGSQAQAFDALVGVGAGFTAACWLIVPLVAWRGDAEKQSE